MKKKLIGNDGFCYECGDKGFLDKACPSCGREPRKLSINFEAEHTASFVEKIESFGVPKKYQGVFWNADMLRKYHMDLAENVQFQRFISQLQKVNDFFVKGVLSEKSALIIAPAGFSKMVFAYSCMQRALEAGFSVAPFLDTVELKRLFVLSGENPSYKLFNQVSYDDYIVSDVCFVTVTKLPAREWAYNVIQELLDKRSRRGLGTFIISRYGLSEISRRDVSNQFGVMSTAVTEDDYKYPAVIRFMPYV